MPGQRGQFALLKDLRACSPGWPFGCGVNTPADKEGQGVPEVTLRTGVGLEGLCIGIGRLRSGRIVRLAGSRKE